MEENLHCLRKGTRLIGRYTIEGVLGQGGFGITYLGIDELHEKKVAIKEFFPQGIVTRNIEYQDTVTVTFVGEKDNYEKGKERFLKEARTMAKFSKDEGIVKALDFFEINNTAYIVMEYLEGITLKQYLRENQRIAPEDLIELLVPLIESLDEIHSQGMIHRDISPDNIMVLPDGRIKLMDFGAARDYTEFGEKSLSIVLKPGYAPPEQYQTHGVQGPWTDIYALCATMYKCITGENPPDAIERVMDDSLKKISEFGITIPPQEEAAIIKGMSVSAKDRYQDIKDFCEDLYGAYEETPASENKESEVKPDLIKENVEDKVDTSAEETPESGSLASEEDVESEKESAKENREAVSQKKVDRKSLKQYENKEETSVQNVKSEPDNKKQSQPKKFSGKAVLAVILCILLVGGGVKLYSDKKEQQYTLHNPKIEDDSSAKSGKKVSWDCLWFGSYPQTQIREKDGAIYTILKNSLEKKEGLGEYKIKISDETLRKIAETANGDVRTALNGLEVAVLTTNIGSDGYITITDEIAKESVQNRKAIFDKKGDSHYDNISAFIKSMRGIDPDAAIFYLARALNGGEDPMFLARRIVIAASEDVGMANPNALILATSAMEAVHMVGMPEARIILAEAAVYVATSKKSNASYLAINQALEDVANKDTGEVPMHIRNAPAEGMEKEGYHVGYKYPHDYPGHYVEQQYLPDKMLGTKYYIKDENIPD